MSIIPDDKRLPLLQGMREVLADEQSWTQHTYARTDDGTDTFSFTELVERGVCFCTLGAAYKAAAALKMVDAIDSYFDNEVGELLFGCGPERVKEDDSYFDILGPVVLTAPWNDNSERTHAEIVNAISCAIDNEKQRLLLDPSAEE